MHLCFLVCIVADRKLFDGFILKINKALASLNFELRGCIDQYDGQVYYGVINTVSDEQSKMGTNYTVPQIAFYKAIVSPPERATLFVIFCLCSCLCLSDYVERVLGVRALVCSETCSCLTIYG